MLFVVVVKNSPGMWVFDVLVIFLGLEEMHTKYPYPPTLTQPTAHYPSIQ